jgi:hypothetical protein
MRRQYHFRPSDKGFKAWDVHRLVRLTENFPRIRVPLDAIRELDQPYWFSGGDHDATCRAVLEHTRAIHEADLRYPIILSADGGVMDGMHRVAKAVLLGLDTIDAVQFEQDPEPDYVDVSPEDLPYDEAPPPLDPNLE